MKLLYIHFYLIKNSRKSYCNYIKYCIRNFEKPKSNTLVKLVKLAEISRILKGNGK